MSSPPPKRKSSPPPKRKSSGNSGSRCAASASTSAAHHKKRGRPKGSVSQTRIRPLMVVNPETGEDFVPIDCKMMGDPAANRDMVYMYRTHNPGDAYERLDQQNSRLILKSTR